MQDFLNGVCNNIMHMDGRWVDVFIYYYLKLVYNVPCTITDLWVYFVCRKLKFYGGNYDAFMKTRLELMEAQGKQYQWEQDQIAHMKVGIFFIELLFSLYTLLTQAGLWITINFIRSKHFQRSLQWFKNASLLFAEEREKAFSGDDTSVILGVQCTTWIRNSNPATARGWY